MATNYLKPQEPLKQIDKETGDINCFYPLVTDDQVILEDGTRLNTALNESVLYYGDGSTDAEVVMGLSEVVKQELIAEIIATLQTPVFGMIDSENNIILTGNLTDGTYTIKYEFSDGTVRDIGNITIGETEPTYTNILDEVGFTADKRISTSTGNLSDNAGTYVTGLIPVTQGDIIRLANITMPETSESYYNQVAFYDANKAVLGVYALLTSVTNASPIYTNGNLSQFTMYHETAKYIRITAQLIDSTSIITVNEPIE